MDESDGQEFEFHCPHCGHKLDEFREECPVCGQPLADAYSAKYHPTGSRLAKAIAYIVLISGALLIIAAIIAFFMHAPPPGGP